MEGGGDESREQQEADEMGVGSSAEVRHERERDELEQCERGRVPCNWDAVLMRWHERSKCPVPTPGQPAR